MSWQENGKKYKLEWEIFFVVVDFANVFGANLHIWSTLNSGSKIFIFLRSNISLCGIGIICVVLRYFVCSPFVSVVPSCIDPTFWIALNMRLRFVNEWGILTFSFTSFHTNDINWICVKAIDSTSSIYRYMLVISKLFLYYNIKSSLCKIRTVIRIKTNQLPLKLHATIMVNLVY